MAVSDNAARRGYIVADATMHQDQRTMHAHYLNHEAAFRAFNPEFDAGFGGRWLAAVEAAEAATGHTERTGALMELTAGLSATMDQARQALQRLFYFVGQAFPDNGGHLDQYGRRGYLAARKQTDKMSGLLQMALAAATRDAAALAAKGFSAALLAELGALATALPAAASAKAIQKGTNAEDRARYVAAQNAAYAYGQAASAAAKICFTERATVALFRLSGPAATPPERHAITAPAGGSKAVAFATALLPDTPLRLRLPAPKKGQTATVYRVSAPDEPLVGGVLLAAGERRLDVLAGELGPAGQLLVVLSGGAYPVRVALAVR
ncbi:hypothetical protein GCM10028824_26580 [Hymenobacter segetis]|uniref:Uncharacterized protein n=1 Tax=Hymenobacter segetis TaxID=2025509 RepID=A0ABU9LXN5_9BACT